MADQTSQRSQSADDELANRIAAAIETGGLIVADKTTSVREGLRKGSLNSAEWKHLAELSLSKKEGEPQQ